MGLFTSRKRSPTLKASPTDLKMPQVLLGLNSSRHSSHSSTGRSPVRSIPATPIELPSEPYDAPPAYSPQDPTSSHLRNTAPTTTVTNAVPATTVSAGLDSPYAFLGQFDTIFLIDDSGSMAGHCWRQTEAALAAITPICTAHDADGLDIYFLNHRNPRGAATSGAYTKITRSSDVHEIFGMVSPQGGTPTGRRLGDILQPYLQRLRAAMRVNPDNLDMMVRPLNIIVITDGVATDDVESVIVNAARQLDTINAQPWQIGIQFFQVGSEPEAAEELRDLDDALSEQKGIRDMVDTVPYMGQIGGGMTGENILKVVLGAVHRKYDRRSASGRRERSTQRR